MIQQFLFGAETDFAKRRTGGHAAPPGTGPEGETCKTCEHYVHRPSGSGKVFRKCLLMRRAWTNGPGSDIRAKDPACREWEPYQPENGEA